MEVFNELTVLFISQLSMVIIKSEGDERVGWVMIGTLVINIMINTG